MIKYINLKKTFEGVLSSSMKNGNKMGTLVPKGANYDTHQISKGREMKTISPDLTPSILIHFRTKTLSAISISSVMNPVKTNIF